MYPLESLFAAIIPMLVYLYFIWKLDRFEPEPVKIVLKSFLWGAFAAVFIAIIGSLIFNSFLSLFIKSENIAFAGTVITAPIIEEAAKGIFLIYLAKNIVFDNVTDGLVYGGAIGLGFGMTENFFYFFGSDGSISGWIATIIIRTLFSAVMHCISTGTLGAFIGAAKFSDENRKRLAFTGLLISIIIHFLWNLNVSFDSTFFFAFYMLICLAIAFFAAFYFAIKFESKIILKELTAEAEEGVIPPEFPIIISGKIRNSTGWINENIREKFIYNAIKLSFRKIQVRKSSGNQKKLYFEDEIKLRQLIKKMLSENHE